MSLVTRTQVTDIKHQDDGRWTWKVDGKEYSTNRAGNGIFEQDEYGCFNKQTIGTCQFTACKTVSGMRRKLRNWFCSWEYEEY